MGATLTRYPLQGRIFWIPAAVTAIVLAFAGQVFAGETSGQNDAYGGLVEVAVGDVLDIPAWDRVSVQINRDEQEVAKCTTQGSCTGAAVAKFARFLEDVEGLDPGAQVQAVNDFFNQLPYESDEALFGVEDLWQSPLSFVNGAGDCEDYAIAKYAALRLLGFPEDSLRLIVLMDEGRGVPHAVLEVRAYGRRWLLDNLNSRADVAMDKHYRPLYALNEEDHWVFVPADGPEQQEVTYSRPASGN
jgi:predicted transglutaminase-like cysteine proteinase